MINSNFTAFLFTFGSVLYTPSTSVKISHLSAFKAAAYATAVVSEPPLPKVVISLFAFIP